MKKIRVIIVGFGFIGKVHAKNILDSEYIELCAFVDPDVNAVNRIQGNFDNGEILPDVLYEINRYDSLEHCLEKETPDAAIICVHTLLHREIAMKAMKAGLHVLVEKPFVLNISEGEEMIAEAKRRNLVLDVGHVVRFMPAYKHLYRMYRKCEYGKLKFLSATRFSGAPVWGEWRKLRKDFGVSGGALFDLVIHDIDFIRHMMGEPDEITVETQPGVLSNHDYVYAVWRYANSDAKVKIEGGMNFHITFPFEASFKAVFENASVVWSSLKERELNIAYDHHLVTAYIHDTSDGYYEEDDAFALRIINGETSTDNAESALDTVRLCYRHTK
jgi:predicted dehydrogenase